jgi:hypothetical protein
LTRAASENGLVMTDMLVERQYPPLMVYLVWLEYTHL